MMDLHIDFETRSAVDLTKAGVYSYALSDTTDIWCAAYAFGDAEPATWTLGEPCPPEIVEHVKSGGIIKAYNANFERTMWRGVCARKYGWPLPRDEQFHCVMVRALAMALPGKLELAAPAVGMDLQKDMAGSRLMLQMCRPRTYRPLRWWDDPGKLERLLEYCKQDVRVEIELEKRLLMLNNREQLIYALDQKINDRGVRIDSRLCLAAEKIVEQTYAVLDREMAQVTKGAVEGCANVQQLLAWLNNKGVSTKSVNKDTLTELLGLDDLPPECRRALELRQESAKTSVAKIDSMLTRMNGDLRMRGNLQFHGAATGRWAARGTQLQNLPRPKEKDIEGAINAILTGETKRVAMLYGPPLSIVSDCVRSMIVSAPGHDLIASDFSNIEGRVIAWLAEQDDLVEMFRNGQPIYEFMASKIYNRPVETIGKDSAERQLGKTAVLGCGYGMGAKKFRETCRKQGIIIDDDLAKTTVRAYRQTNDRIVAFWYGLEDAAVRAIKNPGTAFSFSRVAYVVKGSFLWCQLPSGRLLCYPYPSLRDKETPWSREARIDWLSQHGVSLPSTSTTDEINAAIETCMKDDPLAFVGPLASSALPPAPEFKECIWYKGVDTYTRKWGDTTTYGGKLAENVVQATARDIMADAMIRLELADYPVVLTVHDEVVCEVPETHGLTVWDAKRKTFHDSEFDRIMAEVPPWADGCPVAAEGWRGKRYRK